MRVNEEERGQEEEDLKDKLVIASCKQTVIRSIMKWYRKLELTGYLMLRNYSSLSGV